MNVIEDIRNKVTIGEREASNVNSSDFPGTYVSYDDEWDQSKFEKTFRIDIVNIDDLSMEFDMIGIDASLANALRRILLEEVPSMAMDRIEIKNNTSMMTDEMLAHRLGMIPFKADPSLFEYRPKDSSEITSMDAIGFKLHVKCTKNPKAPKGTTDKHLLYLHTKVTSKDLTWFPIGTQSYTSSEETPKPVDDEILITYLNPGQEIDLVGYCFKGIGKDHAKFSPVATAFYRLLPEITLKDRVIGEDALKLKASFSDGVIGVFENEDGEKEAKVIDSRKDMLSRNIFQFQHLKDSIDIKLIRNHFIFSVESTGVMPPEVLFAEAVKVFIKKCKHFIKEIDDL